MKILYIAWSAPVPPDTGSRQRTQLLYDALSEIGQVDFISLHSKDSYSGLNVERMRSEFSLIAMQGIRVASGKGVTSSFIRRVIHNLDVSSYLFSKNQDLLGRLGNAFCPGNYDVVVARYLRSAANLAIWEYGVPCCVDIDDLDSASYESRRRATKNPITRILLAHHSNKTQRAEAMVLRRLPFGWVANPRDRSANMWLENYAVLPNIPFSSPSGASEFQPSPRNFSVMVIGSMNFKPNVEGVDWFLNWVWPIVQKRLPNARFEIYGSGISSECLERWKGFSGVTVKGFVVCVENAYASNALVVSPVRRGAGTNVKVVEAGFYSRACVTTVIGSRGFVEEGYDEDLLPVADHPDGMALRIVQLLENPDCRDDLARRFHSKVVRDFSFSRFSNSVKSVVNESRMRQWI